MQISPPSLGLVNLALRSGARSFHIGYFSPFLLCRCGNEVVDATVDGALLHIADRVTGGHAPVI